MKKLSIFTVALSASLTLASCTNPDEEADSIDAEPKVEEKIEKDSTNETEDGKGLSTISLELTLDDAVNLFSNHFDSPKINIESIQLKEKNGRYIYELEGWDGQYEYELEFNAQNSEIIEEEKEESNDEEDVLDFKSAISPLEAMDAVLELRDENDYVTEWELEVEDEQMIYDIDLKSGEDQKVDALTGEIL
ncbi:MAG: hypothetical protein L0I79_01500 [Atopostipes sp.]|nr:hypothetical protein [Atopostipes sp.]